MDRGTKMTLSLGAAVLAGECLIFTVINAKKGDYKAAAVDAAATIAGVVTASKLLSDIEGELVDKYNTLVNDYNTVGKKYNDLQDDYKKLLHDSKEIAKSYNKAKGVGM